MSACTENLQRSMLSREEKKEAQDRLIQEHDDINSQVKSLKEEYMEALDSGYDREALGVADDICNLEQELKEIEKQASAFGNISLMDRLTQRF